MSSNSGGRSHELSKQRWRTPFGTQLRSSFSNAYRCRGVQNIHFECTLHSLFTLIDEGPPPIFPASHLSFSAGRCLQPGSIATAMVTKTTRGPSTCTGSLFVSTHSGSPFPFVGTGPSIAQAPIDTPGLSELGYAPLCLSSLQMGSSGSVPPFGAIPIPLGSGGPDQQHARPLPPLPHNGQQLLVKPPLSGAVVGGERKREGVVTIVTDIRSVIHHSRSRSGAGVAKVEGLARSYDVQRDTSGAALDTWTKLEIAPSQLSGDGDGDGTGRGQTKHCGPPPLPPSHTPNNRS